MVDRQSFEDPLSTFFEFGALAVCVPEKPSPKSLWGHHHIGSLAVRSLKKAMIAMINTFPDPYDGTVLLFRGRSFDTVDRGCPQYPSV